jgi:hypothetical protein
VIIALYIAATVIMAVGSLYLAWRNRDFRQISGRRVLRVIGHFILSLSRRCFGATVGDKFRRNTSDPALFTRGEISHIRIWSAGQGMEVLQLLRQKAKTR